MKHVLLVAGSPKAPDRSRWRRAHAEAVAADPGMMGGNLSHEFMVRSPYGEDRIATCTGCGYLASRDIAARALPQAVSGASQKKLEVFDTPNLKTIDKITSHFKLKTYELVKTIIYFSDGKPVAACVRGDHEVHEGKVRKLLGARQLRLATEDEIKQVSGAPLGFTGPVGLGDVLIIVDGDVAARMDFVTGANQKDKHFRNVNLNRDFHAHQIADIRYAQEGDRCAQCGQALSLITTMEVGHVFKLGTRYTDPFRALYRARDGKERPVLMGCYGLGLNRIVAAIIEQHHDAKGIQWPVSVAPYLVHLVTVNQEDEKTREAADEIYEELNQTKLTCLYDNRDERAGVKFNDADLIGNPIQVIVSARNLAKGQLEVKVRKSQESIFVSRKELMAEIQSLSSRPS